MVRTPGDFLHSALAVYVWLNWNDPQGLVMRVLIENAEIALLAFGSIFIRVRLPGSEGDPFGVRRDRERTHGTGPVCKRPSFAAVQRDSVNVSFCAAIGSEKDPLRIR